MSKTYTVLHSCDLGDLNIVLVSQAKLKSFVSDDESLSSEAREQLVIDCLCHCVLDKDGNRVFRDKEHIMTDFPARFMGELYLAVVRLNQPDYSKKN